MRKPFIKPDREQAHGEEMANSISHGVGLAASLIGTPFLLMHASQYGDTGFVIGSILFAASIILLYLSSALYHWLPMGRNKRIFRSIERAAIFILIAGTYSPLTLGVLRGCWGWTLLALIWILAVIGVALEVFKKFPLPIFSTSLYLLMGWLVAVAAKPLYDRMPLAGLVWLVAGGLFYTFGVAFFVTDSRLRYGHLIWHLFVMAGTICHYWTVFWYAV